MLLLTGETASGKSALALRLAEHFDAEIVGADSRQIYRGMTIGTAAPSLADRACVPHHLVEFLDPRQRYSAGRFVEDAARTIGEIHARGRRAIVVGGTGFYLRSLAGDVTLGAPTEDSIRRRIARECAVHSLDWLAEWLRILDAERAALVPAGDAYRTARALEDVLTRRAPEAADARALPTLRALGLPFVKLRLVVDRDRLAERIERRVDRMFAAGFVAEAERIGSDAVASDAVGYQHALAYLDGCETEEEARRLVARATRRYAKRQATWFRSEPNVIDVPEADALARISEIATRELRWKRVR